MTTPILGITELANNQVDQFATANEAFRALEAAANAVITVDLSSGNVSVPAADYKAFGVFIAIGAAIAGRELSIPSSQRAVIILNTGTESINVLCGSASESLAAGAGAWFVTTGDADTLFKI